MQRATAASSGWPSGAAGDRRHAVDDEHAHSELHNSGKNFWAGVLRCAHRSEPSFRLVFDTPLSCTACERPGERGFKGSGREPGDAISVPSPNELDIYIIFCDATYYTITYLDVAQL